MSILCIRPHEVDWLAIQLNRVYVLDLRGQRIGDDGGALLSRGLEKNTTLIALAMQVRGSDAARLVQAQVQARRLQGY